MEVQIQEMQTDGLKWHHIDNIDNYIRLEENAYSKECR